ncbi:hypothetical protein INQ51_03995 [Maribellus sp. CM-23]|uniref:reverse transcriptase domain-containing protein n=1 Tax=Maribellus sp. CM-23 TaxID=2781026 RepID=UPI001EFF1EB2|nr:reverse transcriptase domain-containing protein [Maribellus sp. CM-23]MCE4563462.1 hypothetical protein [Maribellus sp. CM-23]
MENTLLYKISSEANLLNAWGKLNKMNRLSHGMDKVSIEEFAANIDDKINSISRRLREGKYKFTQSRAVLIPKSNGKFRPLQVPIVADRLVLKSIAIELEEQFKEIIAKSEGLSFAYQKKLGIKDAVEKIVEHYTNGYDVVLEADLVNFFGEVDKERVLKEQVFPALPDTSLNELITLALNQKIGGLESIPKDRRHYFDGLNKGIPQGNPLSPLLSNLYLSPFDMFLKDKGHKLVRYADDFVVLCKSTEEAMRAYKDSVSVCHDLGLRIHSMEEKEKTKIVEAKNTTYDFLSITFDGIRYYPSRENVDRFKSKIRDVCNGRIEYNVLTLLKKVHNVFDGWVSAFYYTQVDKYAEELDYFINRQLYLSLRRFDWKLTASSRAKLPKKYRLEEGSHDCLSSIQRESSGIPMCIEMLTQKRNIDIQNSES